MSVEIQEFLSGSSSSLWLRKKKHRKSTPNESVKIPIRIKKLYNHNMWALIEAKEKKKKYRKNIKEKHEEREERSKELPAFGVIPIYLLSSS